MSPRRVITTQSATEPAPYVPWVEAARVVLMAGVVLVHANIFLVRSGPADWFPGGDRSTMLLGLLVPAFFLISGFVLARGDVTAPTFDVRRFVRRRVLSLLVPFFLWNAILVGLDLGGPGIFLQKDDPKVVGSALFRLFTGYWQLYFVLALLQCIGLFLLVRSRLDGRGPFAVAMAACAVSGAFYVTTSLLFWNGLGRDGFAESVLDRTFAPWVAYFFLGVWLSRRTAALERAIRLWWLWALLALGLHQTALLELRAEMAVMGGDAPIIQFLGATFPFEYLGTLAFFTAFGRLGQSALGRRVVVAVARWAPLTFGVYLCHTAILSQLFLLWLSQQPKAQPNVPLFWLMTLALATLVTYLARFLGPVGRVLFALRPARATVATQTTRPAD